jgi:trimethylamine:corrinoid methyltransferase-like protein
VRAGEHFLPRIGSRLPFEQWLAEGRTEADAADDAVRAALAAREERGPRLTADQRSELAAVCDVTVSAT